MDSKSLMIGDWVYFHAGYYEKPVGCTLQMIPIQVTIKALEDTLPLSPIPLTDDILKANGWSKEEIPSEYLCEVCGKYTSPDGRVIVCHFDTNSKEWGVHLDNDHFSTVGYFECDYVHELQQALRLCGLNELADNFKIE